MKKLIPSLSTAFSGCRLSVNDAALQRGQKHLFAGINILLDCGDLVWIAGENGIGKTSFLRVCAGMLRPDTGNISWRKDHHAAGPQQAISFQSHQGHAKAGLTALEDLTFWTKQMGGVGLADNILAAVGLDAAQHTKTQHLSAGQSRRLALAKLIAENRPIWIMDEPLAGMDEAGKSLITDCVSAHLARGGIAMIASHNPSDMPAPNTRRLTLQSTPTPKASAA